MGNEIPPSQQTTGIAGKAKLTTVKQCISRNGCNIHVTPAPASAIGTLDYYYDASKENACEGWLSRQFDFLNRHQGCKHSVPDYYQYYGDVYIRKFTNELSPKLSTAGKDWLIEARKLLQVYMEDGFKHNLNMTEIKTKCESYPDASASIKVSKLESLELDNEKFRTFAFGTHPPAYIDAGLGDLPFMDLVHIGNTPALKEWLKLDSWAQFWEIVKYLSHDKLNKMQEIPDRVIEELRKEGIRVSETILERGTKAIKQEIARQLDKLFSFPSLPSLY